MASSLEFVFPARVGQDEVRFSISEEGAEISFLGAPGLRIPLPVGEILGVRVITGLRDEASLVVYESGRIVYATLTMAFEDALRARTILHELLGVPDLSRQ